MSTNKIRVAVTGVGGGVGQSIIKALQDSRYEVVALDGEVLGTGLYAAAVSYIIPYASDPEFIERLIDICKKENCQFLFPGLDAELMIISNNQARFKEEGIQVIVSKPDVIELSDDKMLTYTRLSKYGFDVPVTVDMSQNNKNTTLIDFPYILKRRVGGARSKDVYLIENQEMLDGLLEGGLRLEDFVAQQYIEGDEYTCGTISMGDKCFGVIVMRRILRDGDTYKCFSVRDEKLEAYIKTVVETLKPFGACNIQLRIKDGKFYIFEVNARCSGTTAARALCGFNEPKMILDYLTDGVVPNYTIVEQTILRYWKELIVPNSTTNLINEQGSINHKDYTKL